MPFKEGNTGRPKGAINKQTRDIKAVIAHLIERLQDGKLDEMLDTLFIDKPDVVLNFIAKIAPKDLTIKGEIIHHPIAEELKKLRESREK